MTRDNAILHASEINSLAEALSKRNRVFLKQGMSFEDVSQNITNWITTLNKTQGDEKIMPFENGEMRMPAWTIDWDDKVIVSDFAVSDFATKEFGSESLSEEPETHVSLDDVLHMGGVQND